VTRSHKVLRRPTGRLICWSPSDIRQVGRLQLQRWSDLEGRGAIAIHEDPTDPPGHLMLPTVIQHHTTFEELEPCWKFHARRSKDIVVQPSLQNIMLIHVLFCKGHNRARFFLHFLIRNAQCISVLSGRNKDLHGGEDLHTKSWCTVQHDKMN